MNKNRLQDQIEKEFPNVTINEAMGFRDEFWPDLARVKIDDLNGKTVMLKDFGVMTGIEGKFGIHDLWVMRCEDYEAGEFTTISSHKVISDKLAKLSTKRDLLPLMITFDYSKNYWNIK